MEFDAKEAGAKGLGISNHQEVPPHHSHQAHLVRTAKRLLRKEIALYGDIYKPLR